ncbi:MAG: excisionase family DNA-binding protein [Bacteroidota bacterium]
MPNLNSVELRLDNIEKLLTAQKAVLTFDEFCKYAGITKSYGYKLTSAGKVKHYCPNGKMLYFNKDEVDQWLMQNPITTAEQIDKEASSYVTINRGGVK